MPLSPWELLSLITRVVTYFGVAAAIGGSFIMLLSRDLPQLRQSLRGYCTLGLWLGLLATGLGFFIQVALFAELGISGLWHWPTAGILWNTNLGTSVQLRLGGLLLGLALFWAGGLGGNKYLVLRGWLAYGVMALLLSTSFVAVGHTVQLSPFIRLLLIVHLLFVAGWIGSLWPLVRACELLPSNTLALLMRRFGRLAIVGVPLLGVAGVTMAYQLLGSVEVLVGTVYGQLLLVKLVLFVVLLWLAAMNKWRWLPALSSREDAAAPLARSIRWELAVALVVFTLTAVLSSLLGPEVM